MKNITHRPLPSKTKKLNLVQKLLILLILILVGMTALPILIIIFIGMLPTITLLITDSKNSQKLMSVGCFNLAGVFIYLGGIFNNFTMQNAFFMVSNIFNLIIMLGTAGLGLVLYCEMPNLFIFMSRISAEKRLKTIDARLQKLNEEWGESAIRLD